MRGLKHPERENEKFFSFFKILQEFAQKHGAIFFIDSGEGRELFTDTLEGENLSGWLIPINKADEFEKFWKSTSDNSTLFGTRWDDMFRFAIWSMDNGNLSIEFKE